jgi:preprotein translocase subunit YajC
MFISPAFAQAGDAVGGGFMEFLPLVLIAVVFYFLLIRPQQKRAKEHKAMVAAVRRGDNVVTAGGIMGKVAKVESAEEVVVEIADGVRVNIVTSTLSDVRSKGEPAKDNDN